MPVQTLYIGQISSKLLQVPRVATSTLVEARVIARVVAGGFVMDALRTPDDRFAGLADYDFAPNYIDIDDTDGGRLRVHYVDEGPASAAPVLLMHGEPTWSYLYRHMIPRIVARGHRVIAPDLVGFGKSDKPAACEDYTYQRHVDWMLQVLRGLDLTKATLFGQDWGGLIGLRLWAAEPDRFARVVVGNTALPTGDQPMNPAFKSWREFSQTVPDFPAGRIVYGGAVSKLSDAEVAAYDAPFPDASYQAGARQFPMLVPDRPDDPASEANRAAWATLRSLDTPVLTVFGADDMVMAGVEKVFQKLLPGAAGQPHVVLPDAGHFCRRMSGRTRGPHLRFHRQHVVESKKSAGLTRALLPGNAPKLVLCNPAGIAAGGNPAPVWPGMCRAAPQRPTRTRQPPARPVPVVCGPAPCHIRSGPFEHPTAKHSAPSR